MSAIIVQKPFNKILIIGPIYDKIEKLSNIENIANQYDWIVFNGGICFPGNDNKVKYQIDKMKHFIASYKAIYLVGRTDYLFANETKNKEISDWVMNNNNVAIFEFSTRSLIVVDGGITNDILLKKQLYDNLELSFVSNIDNKSWHESYNGNIGYVISNNPLTNAAPQHYSHSMQIGNFYNSDVCIYAQPADEIGLQPIILI